MPAFPDLQQFWMTIYGGYGYDCGAAGALFMNLAAGVAQPGNPPYTINDFLAMYPKFVGTPVTTPAVTNGTNGVSGIASPTGLANGQLVTGPGVQPATVITAVATTPLDFVGDLTANDAIVRNVSSTTGLVVGQPIAAVGIVVGTTIAAIDPTNHLVGLSKQATATQAASELTATATSLTLSQAVTGSGNVTLSIYASPLVPPFVIQTYINLAYASLMSSRWREAWLVAMGLYIAHFLTLYCQTDGNPQSTAGQVVANGLQAGITVSQAADGVSQGLQPLVALDNWAAWTLTSYGTQLATMARVVGAGAVYFKG